MRALARSAVAVAVAGLALGLPAAAAAAQDAGSLGCPPSVGGLELWGSVRHEGDLGPRFTLDCTYASNPDDALASDAVYLVVTWDETADGGDALGIEMCTGEEDVVAAPADEANEAAEVTITTLRSSDRRAQLGIKVWDYVDPPSRVDPQPFLALGRALLAGAEERALPCDRPAQEEGAAPVPSPTSAPADRRRTGGGLVALGAGLTLLAGAGSVAAGRRRSRVGGSGSAPPPTLYSGADSIRILVDAGMLEPVHGEGGELLGYRARGGLERFLATTPAGPVRFGDVVHTPGGRATHLEAVAFEEHPDGLLRGLTIAVREGAPAPGDVVAGASPPPEPPEVAAGEDGESLGDRMARVYFRAHVSWLPFELVLDPPRPGTPRAPEPSAGEPVDVPSEPEPAPAEPPQSPEPAPAGLGDVAGWLGSPGWKSIRPEQLHRLLPGVVAGDGTLKPFPYAGSKPDVTIAGGSFSIRISSPLPFVPDAVVRGSLALASDGGIAPSLDEISVGGAPFGDPADLQRQAGEHLDRFLQPVRDAGLRVGDVRLDDGEIRLLLAE